MRHARLPPPRRRDRAVRARGQAQPTVPNPRVLVSGQPTVTLTAPCVVAGCPLPPPPAANGPCVTAQCRDGRGHAVTSNGQPLLLQDSQAICAPTGTPLLDLRRRRCA